MRTALPALLLVVAAACNRAETGANTERAAERMKAVAARTGEQLADSWLTTKIQAQYFADDDIKARNINVRTRDAIVTLSGHVDTPAQRDLALQIAKTTDGVREVKDQLTLRGGAAEQGAVATGGTAPPSPDVRQTIDDAQVTARVQSKFFIDERVKGLHIDVDTRNGVVTLSGQVGTEDERAQALLLARTTEGVERVEDHLTVSPPEPAAETPADSSRIDDTTITTTIRAKYFVDTTVKSSAINVSAKDGVVLLEGAVPSEAARRQAIAIAQNSDGVVQVIDRLKVTGSPR